MEPDYVLKFDESTLLTVKSGFWAVMNKVCIVLIIAPVVFSLLLRTNLYKDMSAYAIGVPVVLLAYSFFNMKHVWEPSPIELRFYSDYMVVYRGKRTYSKKVVQREWFEMRYEDIRDVKLRTDSRRLVVSSKLHLIYYKYRKDGTLPDKPCNDRVVDSGYTIDLRHVQPLNIVKEIEAHSPIKVKFEES